jgi:transcriptional regulator with XRE-family HTH domain
MTARDHFLMKDWSFQGPAIGVRLLPSPGTRGRVEILRLEQGQQIDMSQTPRSARNLSTTRAAAKSMRAMRPAGGSKQRKTKSDPNRLAAASRTTLASRIAFLRRQRGMTLDQLADAAGLTKSYISKVERGLSVPSISTALKIAGTFDLSVGQLLGETQYDDAISIVRRDERPSFMRGGSASGYDYEMLAPGKRFKTMEPYIMRPPLKFQDDRRFEHGGQEMIFVLSGAIELSFGGQSYKLNSGDCVYFDSHIPHRSRSLNGRVAQALVVITA